MRCQNRDHFDPQIGRFCRHTFINPKDLILKIDIIQHFNILRSGTVPA